MWTCILHSELGKGRTNSVTGQVTDRKQCPKPWAERWPGVPAAICTQWYHQALGTAPVWLHGDKQRAPGADMWGCCAELGLFSTEKHRIIKVGKVL